MGIDAMDILSGIGGGLDGYVRYKTWDTENKRRDEELARRKQLDKMLDEDRDEERERRKRDRAEQERTKREAQMEKTITDLANFYAKKGVTLNPEKVRQYAMSGTMPEMPAQGAGLDNVAGAVYNAGRAQGRGLGDQFSSAAMQALMESGKQGGKVVDMQDNLGFAQDTAAYNTALKSAQQAADAERDAKLRTTLAYIAAAGRDGARQDRQDEKLNAAEAWWNDVVKNGAPMDPASPAAANRGRAAEAFNRMRAAHPDWSPQQIMLAVQQGMATGNNMQGVEARTDGTVARTEAARGTSAGGSLDERLNALAGGAPAAGPRAVAPRAPATPPRPTPPPAAAPTMAPTAQQQMISELSAVSQRVQRILSHPNATPEDKAAARAELQRRQAEIVQRYQGATK